MLQTNMLPDNGKPGSAMGNGQADGGIAGLVNTGLAFLRRQYIVIIVAAALATAAAVIYLLVTPPTYSAQAQIIVAGPPQFVQQQSLNLSPFDVNQIETQLQIIKSSPIAVAVINELKLEKDPDLSESLGYRIRAWLWPPPNEQTKTPAQPPETAIKAFQEGLSASRVGYSNIIEISYTSSSPKRAAEIANAVAKAYIADQLNAKLDANRIATGWLQERLRDLDEQALTAERAIGAYKSQNNIVATSGGSSIEEQKLTDINNRLTAARGQASEALVKLNRYETILRSNSLDTASICTLDVGGPDANGINSIREKYLELARSESDLSARFGPDHRAVIDLGTRMRDLRASILDEVRRLAGAAKGELEFSKLRQAELEKQLAQALSQVQSTKAAEITIRSLENQAKTLRGMYDTFLQRYMGSMQQETFPNTETRVFSLAVPPQTKDKPKGKKILFMGLAGGLALGFGLGLLRELMDRVFRTSRQIEAELDLPCLSLVPLLGGAKPAKTTPPERVEEDFDASLDFRRIDNSSFCCRQALVPVC